LLILFKMKMRWHHLVTYAASRCLPPPQPQSMSTPLSHFLVDCRLSPSSWLTTTIIVVISILHLLASSFTPLLLYVPPPSLPIFRQGRVLFGVVTVATSVDRILFDCCVLTVVVVVRLPYLSFDSSFFSMEPPPPRPSTFQSRLPLPP